MHLRAMRAPASPRTERRKSSGKKTTLDSTTSRMHQIPTLDNITLFYLPAVDLKVCFIKLNFSLPSEINWWCETQCCALFFARFTTTRRPVPVASWKVRPALVLPSWMPLTLSPHPHIHMIQLTVAHCCHLGSLAAVAVRKAL